MASGKALLRKYIKKFHKKEIKELKSQNKQLHHQFFIGVMGIFGFIY